MGEFVKKRFRGEASSILEGATTPERRTLEGLLDHEGQKLKAIHDGCKYCRGKEKMQFIFVPEEDEDHDGLDATIFEEVDFIEDIVEIPLDQLCYNFCPYCGRRLDPSW